ncbi:hypothetical protein GCM10023165_46670 [Variovorax defluvii]|uniref:Uncharacterized protein n=1 Tax=Variovorax defluvii TaxID=913761 RepID=A0ABP8IAZ5_9BURK
MILVKTVTGQQAFKDRSIRLTPRQRSAFILFDGKRSVNEVLQAGMGVAPEDIDQMIELGLLGRVGADADAANAASVAIPLLPASEVLSAPAVPPAPIQGRSNQERYKEAYPIAIQLTGGLGLRGFRLNLSVEGTTSYEELLALAPKIRAAVGAERAVALDRALGT